LHQSRRRIKRARTAGAAAEAPPPPSPPPPPPPALLVDKVLSLVADTDGGVAMPPGRRAEVDALLDALDDAQRRSGARPLDDPLLLGDYEVAYTSTARASAQDQRGQPAGGRFRGRLGRALFRTTGVFQSVLPLPPADEAAAAAGDATPSSPSSPSSSSSSPPVALAINKVAFRLFGLIPGYVGLRGKCYACPRPPVPPVQPAGAGGSSSTDGADEDDGDGSTVRVLFERPVLSLGPLAARIGPPSSVVLTTTYLDARVRLGRGSRGSLFVFVRGGAASRANMAEVGAEKPSAVGRAVFLLALGGMVAGGAALWQAGATLAGAALWLAATGLAAVAWQGGVEGDGGRGERAASAKAAAAAAAA
jgi:hypothetical protein